MDDGKLGCLIVLAIAITLTLGLLHYSASYSDPHWETITVKDKNIGIQASNSYLVYTQKEVYEIQDLLYIGFFTSSDVYNQIEVGDMIRVKVYGRRIPFLSAYKNIVEVQPINKDNHGK